MCGDATGAVRLSQELPSWPSPGRGGTHGWQCTVEHCRLFYQVERVLSHLRWFLLSLTRCPGTRRSGVPWPHHSRCCSGETDTQFVVLRVELTQIGNETLIVCGRVFCWKCSCYDAVWQECQRKANEGKFRLRDLLSVPMQRVLKYHLLIHVSSLTAIPFHRADYWQNFNCTTCSILAVWNNFMCSLVAYLVCRSSSSTQTPLTQIRRVCLWHWQKCRLVWQVPNLTEST